MNRSACSSCIDYLEGNTLKQKIQQKQVILGTMLSELSTPNIIRVMKAGGLEFVIIDAEHGPFDLSQLSDLVAEANLCGLPCLVRIPEIRREWITKVLDMGADGMLVPMVSTKEDAEKIVRLAKYPPLGCRGVSTTRAHTNYNPGKLGDYFVEANNRTIILTQIETPEGIENAQDIINVEGVDALMVGPSDLSTSYGFPGDADAPVVQEAIEKVLAAAKAAGKTAGFIHSKPEKLRKWKARGMTIFSCGSELNMIKNGVKRNAEALYAPDDK